MKLRKALDKAKKMRSGKRVGDFHGPVVETRSPEKDWQPPEYSHSIQCQIDNDWLRKNRCVCIDQDAPELEWYKVMRTKILQATKPKGLNTIMITSPSQAEGKTLTSINLALTFAKSYNQTVLLVDCDLRRQNIHKVLGIRSDAGLVDYLVDNRPLKDFMLWPSIEQMTLISGGRSIQNSAELISSDRMKTLVNKMKERYADRYILFDTPPVLVGADSIALAPLVDCILMVVIEGQTTMSDIKRATAALPQEKIIGYVMNRQTNGYQKGYYYY